MEENINEELIEKEKDDNNQQNINLSNSINSSKSEIIPLISEEMQEKKRLTKFLDDINDNIKDNKNENNNIEKIYEEYLKKEFITKKKIKKKSKCFLDFMFYILCPTFATINLIGIFQIISVMKIELKFLKHSTTCLFKYITWNKCEDIKPFNFFNYFFIETLKEPIDYNLMMIMGILGNILLGLIGFTWSSLIFGGINVGASFMIYNFNFNGYDENKNTYNILQIGYILLCFILLSIGVGGSALLSQQILLDSFSKYQNYKPEENENNNINLNDSKEIKDKKYTRGLTFFFIVCLTTILGYYGKYIINIFLAKILNEDNYNRKRQFFFWNIILYISYIGISLFTYFIFRFTFFKDTDNENKENSKQISVYQICGYLIYSETKNNENKTSSTPTCEWYRLFCKTIYDCCNQSICNIICRQTKGNEKYHCCFSFCYECNCCFCCCPCTNCKKKCCKCCECCECCTCSQCCTMGCLEIGNDDFDQPSKVSICYCYKQKRKYKWINMFINNETQIQLTKIMFNYCLLQCITIAFERIYNNNIQKLIERGEVNFINNILNMKRVLLSNILYALIIILFFYITISWGKSLSDSSDNNDDQGNLKDIQELSKDILRGASAILPFNSIFSFIFTMFYISGNEYLQNLITNETYNYIYIPIIMNKFFYFTFTYYCIKVAEEKKGFDLVSGSTLISIYLLIWDSIFGTLRDNIPENYIIILFGIQLLPSLYISFNLLKIISMNLFCNGIFWRTFLYLFFYFFACGGLWFFKCCDWCSCCVCCKCFETKENFNRCCKCGPFDNCCEHKDCLKKCKDSFNRNAKKEAN